MYDFALFIMCFAMCVFFFATTQTVGLRSHRPRRILCYLLGIYLTSAAMTLTVSAVLLRPAFSSGSSYAVAITGSLLAGFFAAGLYSFLGPVTADRSCTAHFLMLLRQQADHSHNAQGLINRFDGRVFMEKRFDECVQSELIQLEAGNVSLTKKGQRMASLYAAQLSGFCLDQRTEFTHSFSAVACQPAPEHQAELVPSPS